MTSAVHTKTRPGIFWFWLSLKKYFILENVLEIVAEERSRDAFQSLEWAADGSIVRLLRKKWSGFWEKKTETGFFWRLVGGFVVLFVEAKCWVIWFVLAPGKIANKSKFKDQPNDCACSFIPHIPLGKRVGPAVGYQIKTYFTYWKWSLSFSLDCSEEAVFLNLVYL